MLKFRETKIRGSASEQFVSRPRGTDAQLSTAQYITNDGYREVLRGISGFHVFWTDTPELYIEYGSEKETVKNPR